MHNGPDMPATLVDWLIYLESLHPKTIALGLERVAQVKQRLNLQADFPIIVVGGTNGKGSVCAMLESILHAAGYRVGCYTSPHLLHYNERVRVAKQPASDAELCKSFELIEQVRGETSLTYFEFGTLSAMQVFIANRVDVAILEVGLGGRLDAVNVFDNDCAVIASVDIDHTDYLGDTREQIAFEKAGIMRSGKVAICADGDVPQAIREHARQVGAQLWCIGDEFSFTAHQGQWDFHGKSGARSSLPYPALRGTYQLHNASAALAALDALKDRFPVSMGGSFPVCSRQAIADTGCGAQSPCGPCTGPESGWSARVPAYLCGIFHAGGQGYCGGSVGAQSTCRYLVGGRRALAAQCER
jgi:dihydrofolate synthase/folylpolyglutamate synthase